MIELRCAGSGSTGNSYALCSGGRILLLEAGVRVQDIKQMIEFETIAVDGCAITHKHSDHARSAAQLERIGIKTFKPYIQPEPVKKLGKFQIKTFPLPHGEAVNYGFVINFDGHVMLYLTDFEYCKYVFTKLMPEYILIECNYQKELIINTEIDNVEHKVLGHAELQTVKDFIKANKTDRLKNIILCHLGRGSDPKKMKATIKRAAGKGVRVDIAEPGMRLRLSE